MRREHLRALLTTAEVADAREAAHRDAMLDLVQAPGDPFARAHWDPGHFTASAFVLSPDGADVLLVYHSKFLRWLQPGGHVEPDDPTILDAARREVEEETGLGGLEAETVFDLDVHDIPARRDDPAHRHFDVRVLLRARSRAFAAASDALACRWVTLDEVERIETDESVMRAVRKLRRH